MLVVRDNFSIFVKRGCNGCISKRNPEWLRQFLCNFEKTENMDLTHNIIEYVNCCVGAFANRFKLSLTQSYAYLRRFKGIDFLIDCYAAEHTLSIDDAVEDIAILCQKNGGRIGC